MSKKILTERIGQHTLTLINESVEGNKNPNILGRLKGVGAHAGQPTRNGRTYSRKLWEKVLASETFKEYLQTKTLYGELNHPADRLETDIKEIAISLTEAKLNDKGELITSYDILNTPNGRILKTLYDYGSELGVSSRGGGETYFEGNAEYVNEDSYDFVAFDVVTLPAVKSARPTVVENKQSQPIKEKILEEVNKENTVLGLRSIKRLVESLEIQKEDIIEKIDEKIEQSVPVLDKGMIADKINSATTAEELNLLSDILNSSNLDNFTELKESIENKKDIISNKEGENITSALLEDLKSALNTVSTLEEKVGSLQKELSANAIREDELKEALEKARQTTKVLGEKAKKSSLINEQLTNKQKLQTNKDRVLTEQKEKLESRLNILRERFVKANTEMNRFKVLSESQDKKYNELLLESEKLSKKYSDKIASMNKDYIIKENSLIDKSNKLIEAYKQRTNDTKKIAESYIRSYAKFNSLDPKELINRLPENFTSKDVDALLEKSLDYKRRIQSLPFNLDDKIEARIVNEQSIITTKPVINNPEDDDLSGMASIMGVMTTGYKK